MSSGFISKFSIRDNIELFVPRNIIKNDVTIFISHGSGGVGDAEKYTAEYFLNAGYKVMILDYFTPHNITNLWWTFKEHIRDDHDITFHNMLTDFDIPCQDKIVHIGFSLGGFLGLINHKRFHHSYCFYPGLIGFTDSMIKDDYTNTTVFNASLDEWCDLYDDFEKLCVMPPRTIDINAHHGFMIPNKNRNIPIAKYKLSTEPITEEMFLSLKPNYYQLSELYGYEPKDITLLSDDVERNNCLKLIEEEIWTY